VANIGLCLFLFLVGLEIETESVKKNARSSVIISLAGICLPFGFGAVLAVPLYNQFIDPEVVNYTHFMLFTGVAYSITAFPVLCRILTELKLLDTTVGIVVLSAGVGNDIIGWTLLALSVALVNAGSSLTALWILLVCFGWTIIMLFPMRYFFTWLARRTGSVESGPTIFFMTTTVLVLFGSAFFTDVIGVHAIFGAFLTGLVVPREGGLAIKITEKLEDMVSIIFLPLVRRAVLFMSPSCADNLAVFYTLWSLHKPSAPRLGLDMGVCRRDLYTRLRRQVWWLHFSGAVRRL
jgi:Kef-type K+ transport system membrane component KefB